VCRTIINDALQARYQHQGTEESLIFGGSGLHVRNRIMACARNVRESVFDHRTNQTIPLIELQYTKDICAICTFRAINTSG